jgi:predicted transcriptional regulator
MDIQTEKLKLIEWLVSLKDQSIIEKLNVFKDNFSESKDWWETLTEGQKKSIEKGLNNVEDGKVTPHIDVMKKYGQ